MKDALSKLRLIIKGFLFSSVFVAGAINHPSASYADTEGIPYNPKYPNAQYPYAQAPNGCGPTGIFGSSPTDVRDTWGSVKFTEACNSHDRCYYTLKSGWNNCNRRFYSDLRAACERDVPKIPLIQIPEPTTLATCYGIASAYYAAVQGGVALSVYDDAQKLQKSYEEWLSTTRGQPALSQLPSPEKIPLTNLQTYADQKGAIAAFVNGHWNGNTGRYNVILITSGAQRIHDVSFDELGISLGTPPEKVPLTNLQTYADQKDAIAAFVNGHWNGNTGRYNVILITSGAQRIHDARFDELGISLGR
jgi:hypothetical protein